MVVFLMNARYSTVIRNIKRAINVKCNICTAKDILFVEGTKLL